ncbi:MAG: hypothetical protein ACD_67C00219G0002 [uncultured bacterium]|nr:MAG: hypothetical protein ACD_67C00219G0002 [uncultured bacterium]
MRKKVLFIVLLVVFALPLCSLASENETRYRFDILVKSSKGKLTKITGTKETVIRRFPVWTSQIKYQKEIPYGKEIPISQVLINPPWTPTDSMLKEQKAKIKKGKKVTLLKKFKPGEPGNPLGRIAFYLDDRYLKVPLRLHGSPSIPKPTTGRDGLLKGAQISKGCTRIDLLDLLVTSNILSEKELSELVRLIQTRKLHELKLKYPVKVKFMAG